MIVALRKFDVLKTNTEVYLLILRTKGYHQTDSPKTEAFYCIFFIKPLREYAWCDWTILWAEFHCTAR